MQTWTDVPQTAKVLDDLFPGWHNKISLDTLNLTTPDRCICGQLGGGTWRHVYQTVHDELKSRGMIESDPPIFLGVFLGVNGDHAKWRQEILLRRTMEPVPELVES